MQFKMEITLGNDAMQSEWDVGAVVKAVGARLCDYENYGPITVEYQNDGPVIDDNGATVGRWWFETTDEEAEEARELVKARNRAREARRPHTPEEMF